MTLPSSGPLTFSDIQTEFGGSNPIGLNEYYAGGGLVPSGTTGTYGAVPTSGQISVQNFYGTSNYIPVYIEELFSTYVYDGNSSVRSIQNGVNLASNGGLVWVRRRNAGEYNILTDTVRGANKQIFTDLTAVQSSTANQITGFNSDGFSLGADTSFGWTNLSSFTYASWTFREQPKFFDIVSYTGNGANRTIAHNLGSVPGCIIVKRTDVAADWQVYHRSLANTEYLVLNSTAAKATGTTLWNSTTPTSTVFSLGTDTTVNASGGTYIAYLFAHDAGGFGLTGSDNVISCGSVTADGSGNATVNLGYEPQWVLIKSSSATNNWAIIDNMRGFPATGLVRFLFPNNANAESLGGLINLNSTGFYSSATLSASATYIYVAIRRGPMKVPTSGTSVFTPTLSTNTGTVTITSGILTDAHLDMDRPFGGYGWFFSRLMNTYYTDTKARAAESDGGATIKWDYMTGYRTGSGSSDWVTYAFKRAPNFFDVVCYTGTGANRTVTHNLGVVPQLMIVKKRTGSLEDWAVYTVTNGNTSWLILNSDVGPSTATRAWNDTTPTASVFTVGTGDETNQNGQNYVAYLFATCSGVSKVGSYTGTGALQTINCGFTGGARFVLIRRSDNTGDWYVWDSARGISSGNDPYLTINSVNPEVTGTNYVDTTSVGFQVTAAAPTGLNASGGTYFFLAIA